MSEGPGGVSVPDSDETADAQVHVVLLCDEDRGDGFVQGRAVHVNGGAYWQHESAETDTEVARDMGN